MRLMMVLPPPRAGCARIPAWLRRHVIDHGVSAASLLSESRKPRTWPNPPEVAVRAGVLPFSVVCFESFP